MEPMHSVWHYLEFQKQLAASKAESQKPSVDAPADKQLNSLRIERIKTGLAEMALFLLFAGLVTFGLACLLSPTFLP